ncbi:FAD-binding oxidoreductase [Aliishimia ponticola]|uniref:FAD-binding oxidoreductase n=1 Tax=Aliishimia ponticola TaxID=2499833 RepID=A0A4S4NCH3_9RHOB|nr:FAD-binding oxidoreductase [Aliishimia ponticola]THH35758.1 FAD-binding oxidoreductase [Aliishimia ponticola]
MKLLYANDRKGSYPESWYAATTAQLPPFASLKGEQRCDVCVIGAGYTGLSAALHLAEAGRDVILIDAQRVGFGASGRNGGQLGSGQRQDQKTLEKMLGRGMAVKLWHLGEEAKGLVKSLIDRHGIDCHLRPGVAWTATRQSEVDDLHAYADFMARQYDYKIEAFGAQAFRDICPSPEYHGGILDMDAGHLHPLAYALGLARAAQAAGVRIFEQTEAHHIEQTSPATIRTGQGRISADHVILATNGYSQGLARPVARNVMPINNFIAATEPLGTRVEEVLRRDIAVSDDRFVINYFRLSHDGRLLFGGGESYGYRFPSDIAAVVRKPMLEIFPSLKDVGIDYAWGGTLAITVKRLPFLARVAPNVLSASGYSGHGVGSATHAGWLMAKAIEGDGDGFDTLGAIPSTAFPGGPAFKSPLLAMAMSWYALRDRLGI